MDENGAALHTAVNAVEAIGRGFDVNFDTRLLYCKGIGGSRIVKIDDEPDRDLWLYDSLVVPNVSRLIKNVSCTHYRQTCGICSYDEMVEYFNKKANLSSNVPLGSFNSVFSFTGSKHVDATTTKSLSVDGFIIPLVKVQIANTSLMLQDSVKRTIPTLWDPPSLASLIENFGTHVITSVTIGGKDVIYARQQQSSSLSSTEMKNYVQDIGNQRFDTESHTSSGPIRMIDKDITVILRGRGGDDLEQSHSLWAKTVESSPDIIEMTFVSITDLIENLARAIGFYLELCV